MRRVRFRDQYASSLSSLADRIPMNGPAVTPRAPPVGRQNASAGLYSDVSTFARELEREALLEQMEDIFEQSEEVARQRLYKHRQLGAPMHRAGYVVAIVLALIVFFFITQVVFAGNKMLTGALIVLTALFFLFALRKMILKRGAGAIGSTAQIITGL